MASLCDYADRGRAIQFTDRTGKRRTIHLGRVPLRVAEEFRRQVERINVAAIGGVAIENDTAKWVAGLPDKSRRKLQSVGLALPRAGGTLERFLTDYIAGRTGAAASTVCNLQVVAARIVEFFGDVDLRSINPGDAEKWGLWLAARYAPATVGRSVRRARQFFKFAVKCELIPANPFMEVRAPAQVNPARAYFIPREAAARVLAACPNDEWRFMFALSRFGGLRCPSEHAVLTWEDFQGDRFRVVSPKTGERWVPLFPELKPFIHPGTGCVFRITPTMNLRTRLLKILAAAKLTPWPRLWHNLRATRQTELEEVYPSHVVCAWMGNSTVVARKHYLQVTDTHFQSAAKSAAAIVERGGN